MSRPVLVLGASGFIGRQLVERLAGEGFPVLAATRQSCGFDSDQVENVVAPFVEAATFSALLERCGAVVHAASSTTPGSSTATPQLDGNLRTTLALLEALQAAPGRRLLYLSSAGTLYGDRDTPAQETDPLRPRSYHGAGKAAAEQFLHAWAAQYDGTAVVLRPSNVYGPGQTARQGFAIVPTAMDCAATGRTLEIWGDGTQLRDYLHVADLVAMCLHALQAPLPSGCHVFNAASGQAVTLKTLLERIERVSGRAIQRRYVQPRIADVGKVLINPQAARQAFGWEARTDLDTGLAQTWQWHQTQA
ncbi:hypothetical protein ABB25_00555 [Stenotrophomonas koreensis]|uniref:UDP-glucose 4-epimerase n=1 Tax=Stenotrophomonas koreensis TaxID=266128 RepID=A0A0R0BTE1_9GAMM|nr:NAD-dependent epimerase/dehydratase family protein [Stenotrophomonas koreensis]KRG60732.1 hypothetical protein ABB25_00555 [Stenotrophomonas koreensis]